MGKTQRFGALWSQWVGRGRGGRGQGILQIQSDLRQLWESCAVHILFCFFLVLLLLCISFLI